MKPSPRTRVHRASKPAHIRVAVIGATGYTGVELIRLLSQHPHVSLAALTSEHYVGKRLSDVYPSFAGKCDLVLEEVQVERLATRFDVAFSALPHRVSMDIVSGLIAAGKRVVDLSADFRLHDADLYARWYGLHKAPEMLRDAVYGLTELHRKRLPRARLVAVPGCYPTAAILGLAPVFAQGLVRGDVLIDAKSGVTGAGRSGSVELSFSEVDENLKAYNVGVHRHTPEIEQELSLIAQKPVPVLFVPHLVPMNRGILATMYVGLNKSLSDVHCERLYRNFYARDPFVRIHPSGNFPQTKDVRGTNDCAIGFRYDSRSKRLVVISAIDNLVKGAAGQAVQNMNVMYGFPEAEGLRGTALVP